MTDKHGEIEVREADQLRERIKGEIEWLRMVAPGAASPDLLNQAADRLHALLDQGATE